MGNSNAHDPRNLPIIVAGGDYHHGHYITDDDDHNTPSFNLFVSMLNDMGLETDAIATSNGQLD